MKTVGIDLGLSTTAVVLMEDKHIERVHCFGTDAPKYFKNLIHAHPINRYKAYYTELETFLADFSVTATIVMEKPHGSFYGDAIKLAELLGVYYMAIEKHVDASKVYLPTAGEIKKAFTGDGACSKTDIVIKCKQLGYFPANEHVADAIAMAVMGHNPKFFLPKK